MKRSSIIVVVVSPMLSMALAGCRMLNPAFDDDARASATGDEQAEGDGDGDPSGSAGDQSTGDGDGDGDGDPGDGDGDPGDGDGDGDSGGITCDQNSDQPDQCGDLCTNFDADPKNCGGCGEACPPSNLCLAAACERPRIMFVTQYSFSGGLGGLAGADDYCALIAAEFIDPQIPFWAWNSVEQADPNNTFSHDGFFVRTDGAMIAKNWAELTNGQLKVPIDHDEAGVAIPLSGPCDHASQVWTGTSAFGDALAPNCLGWTTYSEAYQGTYGDLHATDSSWSAVEANNCGAPARCSEYRRLYCLEL